MTRLEQALRWWGNSRHKVDSTPERYYEPLKKAGYLEDSADDKLNETGVTAMENFGFQKHPESSQWTQKNAKKHGGGVVLNPWDHLNQNQENLDRPNLKNLTNTNAEAIKWFLHRLTYQRWEIKVDGEKGLRITNEKSRPLTKGHWEALSFYFRAIPLPNHPSWLLLPDEISLALKTLMNTLRKVKNTIRDQDAQKALKELEGCWETKGKENALRQAQEAPRKPSEDRNPTRPNCRQVF